MKNYLKNLCMLIVIIIAGTSFIGAIIGFLMLLDFIWKPLALVVPMVFLILWMAYIMHLEDKKAGR